MVLTNRLTTKAHHEKKCKAGMFLYVLKRSVPFVWFFFEAFVVKQTIGLHKLN
jgi:hypothetical protein